MMIASPIQRPKVWCCWSRPANRSAVALLEGSADDVEDLLSPVLLEMELTRYEGFLLFAQPNASAAAPRRATLSIRDEVKSLQERVGRDAWVSPGFRVAKGPIRPTSSMFFLNQYLVKLRTSHLLEAEARLLFRELGLGEILQADAFALERLYLVEALDADVFEALDRIAEIEHEEIERITLVFGAVMRPGLRGGPDVALVDEVRAPEPPALALRWSGQVRVGVAGDGIEGDHPNLSQPIGDPGWHCNQDGFQMPVCHPGGDPTTVDDNHETTVAGVVGSSYGVAPGQSIVFSLELFDEVDCGIIEGVLWSRETVFLAVLGKADEEDLVVLNFSYNLLGTPAPSSVAVHEKFRDLRRKGFVIFAPTGNSAYLPGDPCINQVPPCPPAPVGWPAFDPYVVAVGGLNPQQNDRMDIPVFTTTCGTDTIHFQANVGPEISMSARSEGVTTIDRTGNDGFVPGDTVVVSGTSWSSPFAAGAAARVLAANPDLGAGTVERLLCATATDVTGTGTGWDQETGCGSVNAAAAETAAPDWIFADGFETSFEELDVEWSSAVP